MSKSIKSDWKSGLLYCMLCLSGNAAVIKPSEVSAHTAKLMEDLLPLYGDKVICVCTWVYAVEGFSWVHKDDLNHNILTVTQPYLKLFY